MPDNHNIQSLFSRLLSMSSGSTATIESICALTPYKFHVFGPYDVSDAKLSDYDISPTYEWINGPRDSLYRSRVLQLAKNALSMLETRDSMGARLIGMMDVFREAGLAPTSTFCEVFQAYHQIVAFTGKQLSAYYLATRPTEGPVMGQDLFDTPETVLRDLINFASYRNSASPDCVYRRMREFKPSVASS